MDEFEGPDKDLEEHGARLERPGAAGETNPPISPTPAQSEQPPPRRRRRRRRLIIIIVAAVLVVLVGGSVATAEYTSRSAFCDSCHEMGPYYTSWQESAHAQVDCVDCHVPPGVIPFIETKLFSFREIWVHIAGSPVPPLAVTRDIPDSNCLSCHPDPGDATFGDPDLAGVAFSHDEHTDENCVDCHVRLVHRTVSPPDYVPPGDMSSCLECHDGTNAPGDCSYCHSPPHEPRGECGGCHGLESWTGALTAHPFPLEGAHASLGCSDCHVSKPGVENIPGTQLPQADPACVSCHGDQHGGLTDCASCHTPEGWTPSTFRHPQVGEHIPGGEHRLACADCHPSGFATNSCSCHGGGNFGGD